MQRFRTGAVAGKFYPPHRGHKYLIDTALARCDRVIVLVTDTPVCTIPAETRAAWVREIHPRADVRVIPDIGKDDDSVAWAAHTISFLGFAPDAVFTSEAYGKPWAEALGCAHVSVDPARGTFPVSGTAVREDPFRMWQFLEPPVRAHYALRVRIIGAESTGTTTLAKALAARYATVWVPEYGRLYAEGKVVQSPSPWRSDEFAHIAEQQSRMEDSLARVANKVLVCDTDPFATTIWHERYMGAQSPDVRAIAAERRYGLTILTGDEIPFEQDGLRDGEHLRHGMHRRFEEALVENGIPYLLVRGSREERLERAAKEIDRLLQYKNRYEHAK